ncbi:class I tRNA ligase family protein, partial [Enterococcus faecalis]
LGVRGDWENPYVTLKPEYEAQQIRVFGEMAKRGYIYKGLKPVNWSPSSESALAEAEIEYQDKRSASIYVAFGVKDGKGVLENG